MSTPKPNGPKAPHVDSIPSGLLDDLLDRERAAAEQAKALGPEFQSAAQELREQFNLRPSQPLLQWDSLVEDGARPPTIDHDVLRGRVEGALGAQPKPPAALQKNALQSRAMQQEPGSPAPPPTKEAAASPVGQRGSSRAAIAEDEPSSDGVSAQTAQLEVAKLAPKRTSKADALRSKWMRVLVAAGVVGFGVGFGGAAVFAGGTKGSTKARTTQTPAATTVVASPPSVPQPVASSVATPADTQTQVSAEALVSAPPSATATSATASATGKTTAPTSPPHLPSAKTTTLPATTPTATTPPGTASAGTQPYFQRGNLQ